ncbi:TPA: Fic family protein [Aeromonas hydrophila]|uniref:Fic family protein n=1 Tax=Aeromonas hydrophila TaxID=644 RepID=UPI000C33347D|nr:Fic family protein [Aeromonas hydrophila]PKD24514.1 Filamentation induced by cAMP protein Fic [Aeromonas hydrophila]WRK92150.1 Fic family protein [Aeromonas hydrophila]HAT2712784.1 Fic family protein [Aeromonas hydrophila]
MTNSPRFLHHNLELLNPSFDSPLVDVLNELEHLRRLQLAGDTPAQLFFQLKGIFHLLESLGSARIEGNHTTLADYVENRVDGGMQNADHLREISNIEAAMAYIDEVLEPGLPITEHFIRELHTLAVSALEREGDRTPGAYRQEAVRIAQSTHIPPEHIHVPGYMAELVNFINQADPQKYDLMKVALAHHRFGWVHPFTNGNGRTVRLLTYALLIKYGFNVKDGGRVLNPTAVFCNDRDSYYRMLSEADTGTPEGREVWCTYVLDGILGELKKVDRLTNYAYLQEHVLVPALAYSKQRELLTDVEFKILRLACSQQGLIKAGDLTKAIPELAKPAQRTYQINKLLERKMLQPVQEGARQYVICFANNYLLRGVIQSLREQGFIPAQLEQA